MTLSTRFIVSVSFGDALKTHLWEAGPNGTTEMMFITKNVTTGKVQGPKVMQ
jgi:hypothetical protein